MTRNQDNHAQLETSQAMRVGERLKRAREVLRMNQAELATAIGASKRGLQDNEAGKSVPGGQALAGLASLGININWLLTGHGPERLDATNVDKTQRLATYKIAVELVDGELDAARRMLPKPLLLEAYDLVCDLLMEEGDLPTADVVELRPRARPIVHAAVQGMLRNL